MTKGPGRLTCHHRKPTSIGGAKHDPRNKSTVCRRDHSAWHTLYWNLAAPNILEEHKFYLKTFGAVDGDDESIYGSSSIMVKKLRAWKLLFTNPDGSMMTNDEMFAVVNLTWLDPDYEFIVEPNGKPKCVWRNR